MCTTTGKGACQSADWGAPQTPDACFCPDLSSINSSPHAPFPKSPRILRGKQNAKPRARLSLSFPC